ncbi:hypothetical protein [Paracidovorax citrulli]|uniref:hypothetical protein n=1 Tax=Paracidovorax citrulli TaxID=80869 RepID=UPI001F28B5FF|nr:hypothetical protein [Paracidovorax citrulli]
MRSLRHHEFSMGLVQFLLGVQPLPRLQVQFLARLAGEPGKRREHGVGWTSQGRLDAVLCQRSAHPVVQGAELNDFVFQRFGEFGQPVPVVDVLLVGNDHRAVAFAKRLAQGHDGRLLQGVHGSSDGGRAEPDPGAGPGIARGVVDPRRDDILQRIVHERSGGIRQA